MKSKEKFVLLVKFYNEYYTLNIIYIYIYIFEYYIRSMDFCIFKFSISACEHKREIDHLR